MKLATALDDEARRRGNSTYLVDRVIPMLPEALSNEICSLKPNVDRLTKCVEFLIAQDGRVLKTRAYAAVIHSQRRFSYREAFEVLQRAPASPIERMLHHANELAQRIRRLRFKAGALELDFPEMKIRLDEQGRMARIERVANNVSHQLIEEFMLLANEAVAARLLQANRPAIHRVHEEPDVRRLQEYRAEVLSHHVSCGNLSRRAEVQKLLHRLGTIPSGPALKIGFLKSLMRARYAIEPLGHYGLARKHYAHFTSPIRRYADLVAHRALFEHGHGAKHSLKETADHISTTERNSADAARDSRDVKLYAYLEAQLKSARPQRYPALVTGLRNFGFFVDVTGLGMSGLVPFSELKDDFYSFDAEQLQVVGRRTRRTIKLGDRLEVQIARVDRFKKQVDFRLAQSQAGQSRFTRQAASGPPMPNRRGKFTRSSELRDAPSQAPDRFQRHSGPSRSPASERILRSAHSGQRVCQAPGRRTATMARARPGRLSLSPPGCPLRKGPAEPSVAGLLRSHRHGGWGRRQTRPPGCERRDRKSTRLNSRDGASEHWASFPISSWMPAIKRSVRTASCSTAPCSSPWGSGPWQTRPPG